MGKRGAATAGVPAGSIDSSDDSCDADAVPPLAARWRLWRSQHPPRSYVGAPIQRVSKSRGLPADTSRHKAGGMWTRLQPNPGRFNCAASGASCDQVVSAEFLCVPLARRVGEGEKTPPLGASDDLFEHRDSASGDWFQHVTSVRRWLELAKTHPMVHTCYPYYPRRAARVLDEQGRAVSGEQGEFRLSLSLSATGNVFRVGMRAKSVAPPLVALWWRPMMGTGWTPRETLAARRVFFDLCEVEADSLFPEGAEAQAKDEISGSAHAEGEDDSHGAGSSGASDVQGAPADDEQARAMDAHRQVHLGDVAWPVRQGPVLCRPKKMKQRRQRTLQLVKVLRRVGWPVPNSLAFKHGIPHHPQGVRFLGLLHKKIEGEGFDSGRSFCGAFASLELASGGAPRVESVVDRGHPIWQTLRGTWGVKGLPDFLKHMCNDEHRGEVRLLRRTWVRLPRDFDVRNPEFWSPELMEEEESRRWLKGKDAAQWLTWADVAWVLRWNFNKTLLICKYVVAASGAHVFSIRAGTAATLAQTRRYGEELLTACDICELYMGMPALIRQNTRQEKHRRGQRRRGGEPSGSC